MEDPTKREGTPHEVFFRNHQVLGNVQQCRADKFKDLDAFDNIDEFKLNVVRHFLSDPEKGRTGIVKLLSTQLTINQK